MKDDPPKPRSLRHNHDFMKLWAGEAFSQFGVQNMIVVLPLIAVVTLDASANTVGLLNAAQYAPILVISLFGGVWLDNRRRRPVLVTAYLARAALLALIPALYALDLLTVMALLLIAFAAGAWTAVSDVAYIAYLPQLVSRDQLVRANARLEASYSVAEVGGPGLGGLLAQILSAPLAMIGSVVSSLLAGALNLRIRHQEPPPRAAADREPTWVSIRSGFSATLGHPLFRPLVLQAAVFNLCVAAVLTVLPLYVVRQLGLPEATFGMLISAISVGGLAGTLIAGWAADRFGVGRTIVGAMVLASVPLALLPAAEAVVLPHLAALTAALLLHGVGQGVFNVHSLSLRAMLSPPEGLGRLTATFRFISTGTLSLGALLAGFSGTAIGIHATLWASVILLMVSCVVFAFTRVRSFHGPDARESSDHTTN